MTDNSVKHAALPGDHANRELIVEALDRNILVEAAAGTGKTTSMIDRMIALIRTGACENVRGMAAVTFTRKAASELRARFQAMLELATREAAGVERERLDAALANIDQCFIGTIHSFCGRLLRERPVEAGVDIDFAEMEEEEDEVLRRQAWEEYSLSLFARDDPDGIVRRLSDLAMSLSELESSFMLFGMFPDVDSWPVAPDGLTLPDLAPAISQIRRYLKDLESARLPKDDGQNQRLYSFYVRLRRAFRESEAADQASAIRIIELFYKPEKLSVSRELKKDIKEVAVPLQKRYEDIRENIAMPVLDIVYALRYKVAIEALHKAREVYDTIRAEQGKLNFQDLLMRSADLLGDKPHIRRYFAIRFTHLLVDEFQDTDPVQAQVMLYLTASDHAQRDWKKCVPRPGSLFVVGDPKQSIYRFRRADIVTYNTVREIMKEHGEVVQLSANFRSTSEIIGWCNGVFKGVFPEEATDQSPAFVELLEGRPEGDPGDFTGVRKQSWTSAECDEDIDAVIEEEARTIACTIKDAIVSGKLVARLGKPGEKPAATPATASDFMVIVFNKDYLSIYARKLQEYGVKHEVTGGTALNECRELKLLHLCLDAITRPDDPVALLAVLRSELFGVSDSALYALKAADGHFNLNSRVPEDMKGPGKKVISSSFEMLKKYSGWLRRMPVMSAVERIVADSGLMVLAASRDGGDVQVGSVAKAMEVLRAAQSDFSTCAELVDYLATIVDPQATTDKFDGISVLSSDAPAVRLMNLHKAKGLQAPVVFLASPKTRIGSGVDIYIDRGEEAVTGYLKVSTPVQGALYSRSRMRAQPEGWDEFEQIEKKFNECEKERLRYVAATRAESQLVVSYRADGKGNSLWKDIARHIDCEACKDVKAPAPAPAGKPVTLAEVTAATTVTAERFEEARAPSLSVRAAKELSMSGDYSTDGVTTMLSFASPDPGRSIDVPEGERGAAWGEIVHQLLEIAMASPGVDLDAAARIALEDSEIGTERLDDLLGTVGAVKASALWSRAGASKTRITELPFSVLLDPAADPPLLVRGAIDLAFEEDDGWVIVDYKTDTVPAGSDINDAAAKYAGQVDIYKKAFEMATGRQVKEKALYFVRNDRLVVLK